MIIKSVTVENFGLYKGKQTIELNTNSSNQPVTLIGGMNGRGKTTLLDAITLGLYGKRALKYLQDERIRYAVYIENHIHKGISWGSKASIALELVDSPSSTTILEIRRFWGKPYKVPVEESFEAYRDGVYDEYLSQNWDYFVEEILPLNISRFFFFDSEKISQIADDESFESVKESIRSLLGLTTIDQLIADLKKLSKTVVASAEHRSQSDALCQIETLEHQITECEEQAKEANSHAAASFQLIQRDEALLEERQAEFWKNGGQLGLERDEMLASKEEAVHNLQINLDAVSELVYDGATPISTCKALLARTYNAAKQAEQRQMSKLSDDIIARMKRLLKHDQYDDTFITEMMAFFDHATHELGIDSADSNTTTYSPTATVQMESLIGSIPQKSAQITGLLSMIQALDTRISQIDVQLSREVSNILARELWASMNDLNKTISANEVDRKLALVHVLRLEKEVEKLHNRKVLLIDQCRQEQQSLDEQSRLLKYAHMVMTVMDAFKRRLQAQKVMDLQNMILSCFQAMVQKSSIIQRVEIDPDTLGIKLVDHMGGELLKSQLSAGEKQLFAVSILWGLARSSGYDMPVIIDTPLGRLDSQHRMNFVKGYIPHAGKQVIVLSTDEEINGHYLTELQPYIGAMYMLVYNENTNSTFVQEGYFGGAKK